MYDPLKPYRGVSGLDQTATPLDYKQLSAGYKETVDSQEAVYEKIIESGITPIVQTQFGTRITLGQAASYPESQIYTGGTDYVSIIDDGNQTYRYIIQNLNAGNVATCGFTAANDITDVMSFGIHSTGLGNFGDFNNVAGAGFVILGNNAAGAGASTYPLLIGNENNGDIRFGTNNTERGRFTAGGDFRIAQLTQGSVLFAGASGHVTQDNANLYWNDTENRLGIGKQPSYALDVCGDPTQIHFSESNGTGGGFLVSTTAAQAMMVGGANWNGTNYTARATGACIFGAIASANGDFGIANKTGLTADSTTFNFDIKLYMDTSGNFGINTGTTVARRFEVLDASNPQLRLTHTAATDYADLQVDTDGNLTINVSGSKVLVSGALEIDGNLDHDGSNIGFFGVAPVARAASYTPTNVTTDRSYDADATTVEELADVLGTLIADLKAYGLLQ